VPGGDTEHGILPFPSLRYKLVTTISKGRESVKMNSGAPEAVAADWWNGSV
jgi:hypothetical protein